MWQRLHGLLEPSYSRPHALVLALARAVPAQQLQVKRLTFIEAERTVGVFPIARTVCEDVGAVLVQAFVEASFKLPRLIASRCDGAINQLDKKYCKQNNIGRLHDASLRNRDTK